VIGNTTTNLIWLAVVLASAIGALVAQRAPVSHLIRSAAVWAAIIIVVMVAVSHRYELKAMVAGIDQSLGISEQQVSGSTVRIRMSPDGHFWAQVSINGVARTMLIDSGATNTTISANTARAAGIERDSPGVPVEVNTANGTTIAWPAHAKSVSVSTLSMTDLGVDISNKDDDIEMLGMNFLSKLGSWRVEGNTLVLEPPQNGGGPSTKASSI
jgi:aspartyl protease family protein